MLLGAADGAVGGRPPVVDHQSTATTSPQRLAATNRRPRRQGFPVRFEQGTGTSGTAALAPRPAASRGLRLERSAPPQAHLRHDVSVRACLITRRSMAPTRPLPTLTRPPWTTSSTSPPLLLPCARSSRAARRSWTGSCSSCCCAIADDDSRDGPTPAGRRRGAGAARLTLRQRQLTELVGLAVTGSRTASTCCLDGAPRRAPRGPPAAHRRRDRPRPSHPAELVNRARRTVGLIGAAALAGAAGMHVYWLAGGRTGSAR